MSEIGDVITLAAGDYTDQIAASDLTPAVIAALAEAGYVIVPKEPTDAMMAASYNAMFQDRYDGTQAPMVGAGYDAAIEARPK